MKKQKTTLEREISLSSSKSEDEKELLTESDGNSSNWITESEVTVSQDTLNSSQTDRDTTQPTAESDDSQVVVVNQSDDSQVVVIAKSEGGASNKQKQGNARKEKSLGDGSGSKNERSRGNIPNSTGSRPYLRSHSGSWRNLRKRRQSKTEKISANLPSEEPFQANLAAGAKEVVKPKDPRQTVELPKISDCQDLTEKSPSPPGSSSQPGRISRSIENVISKLDRRSMSVLPQIGKSSSEG